MSRPERFYKIANGRKTIVKRTANFIYYYAPQDQANMEKPARALDQNHARIAQALQ